MIMVNIVIDHLTQTCLESSTVLVSQVGFVFPMVILSEFCMEQYRDDDHREDALHFTQRYFSILNSRAPQIKI